MDKIRIKLLSEDFIQIDKVTVKIVKCALSTNAILNGPIPLETEKKDGKTIYKRIMDIYTNSKTIEELSKIDVPKSVNVEMKG